MREEIRVYFFLLEKVNFWGERRDYWHYLSEVVSKMKTLDGCVKRVQGLSQVSHVTYTVEPHIADNHFVLC